MSASSSTISSATKPVPSDGSGTHRKDSPSLEESSNSSVGAYASNNLDEASNTSEELNIFQAILMSNDEAVDQLLDTSRNDYIVHLKATDNLGRTPLYLACSRGDLRVVKLILNSAAANVESVDKNGWSPLTISAFKGYKDVVAYLLEQSADLDLRESAFDWTPLLAAVWNGHMEVAEMLVEHGASVKVRDKYGRTALFLAAQRNHLALLDSLLKRDSGSVNDVDGNGRTPLYIAVQLRHREAVQRLIQAKANLEIGDHDGRKALFLAHKLGYEDIAELLVAAGADKEMLEVDLAEGMGEPVRPCRGKFVAYAEVPNQVKVTAFCETGEKIWGGCSDGSIIVWDMFSRKRLAFLSKVQGRTISNIIAADASTVWCLSNNSDIYIWNWNAAAISSTDSSLLVSNSQRLNQGTEINPIIRSGNEVYGGSSSATIYIWNTLIPGASKKIQLDTSAVKLQEYESFVSCLLMHNGRLYVAIKKYIFSYDVQNKFAFKGHFEGHSDLITSMVVVDKHLWTSSRDNTIKVWHLDSRECVKTLAEAGGGVVNCMHRTKDEQLLSAGRDGLVRSWDTTSLVWKRTFGARHERDISALHWDSNNRLWVSSLDKTVSVWK